MTVLDLPDQCTGVALAVAVSFPATEQSVHSAKGIIAAGAVTRLQVGEGVVTTKTDAVLLADVVLPVEVTAREVAGEHRRDQVGIDMQAVLDLFGAGEAGGSGKLLR